MLHADGNEEILQAVSPLLRFDHVTEFWHPKIVGQVNDQYLKIARIKGEFVWHDHEQEDELFWVLRGEMEMRFKDRTVAIREGEFLVVPRGTLHQPAADEECLILLIETVTTQHTGRLVSDITVGLADQL